MVVNTRVCWYYTAALCDDPIKFIVIFERSKYLLIITNLFICIHALQNFIYIIETEARMLQIKFKHKTDLMFFLSKTECYRLLNISDDSLGTTFLIFVILA
ncbi:hypothetical protein ACF0H5_021368 [Mactra antiquata]